MATIVDFDNLAALQVGVPYVFGGVNLAGTPNPGLDCSGLPYAVSLALGQSIPRTSEAQFAGLPRINSMQLRRGDLVFYNVPTDNQPQPAHMSIWWSPSQVLQAPRTGEDVMFSAPLPYQIMGYGRLPFPDPTPIPPPPVPILEETMSTTPLPDAAWPNRVLVTAVGAGSRAEHLMAFTINDPTNPNNPGYNVIDVTDGIGTGNPYLVSST